MMTNVAVMIIDADDNCVAYGRYSWLGQALNQLDPFQCPEAHMEVYRV